jgi:hypothetical protein
MDLAGPSVIAEREDAQSVSYLRLLIASQRRWK